ncbi:MAG: F0F1 ATP synthase subunit delta [Bacteroidales bacterium]|nr:F0F1 ATP synthase subunit delta [Bacteroidales bacterium]MDD4821770.1 F0F1 ATP synthase subunit delta [Bacteroidales bacterium]
MNIAGISSRYAKALINFAREENQQDCVYNEFKCLGQSFLEVPALLKALDDPSVSAKEKEKLVVTACGGNVGEVTLRFIRLVLHHKREKYLNRMAMMYMDLYRKEKKIVIGELITAVPADEEIEQRMRKIIQSYRPVTVEFSAKINPAIIGGFVLKIGTYRVDASLYTQLKEMKKKLLIENRK